VSVPTSITHTSLRLLTRDGAVTATFTPALLADQYDELFASVNQQENSAELRRYLTLLAARWQVNLVIDD
jgi:hypothetical protein